MPEVRRLLQVLALPAEERGFPLHWSWWRRAHQAVARRCHTARRARSPNGPAQTTAATAVPPPAVPVRAAPPTPDLFHLADAQWDRVADLLPDSTGGRPARHQRCHLEGLLWLRQTGASWRSLPASYGNWGTLYACYRLWQATGLWQRLLDLLTEGKSEVSL